MGIVEQFAKFANPLLNQAFVRRVRRNHAYEHATIHMLNRQRYRLSGRSSGAGFVVFGNVPTEKVESAAQEALRRLKRGEAHWAIHPNCGTNLATTGFLTTLIAMLGFVGTDRKQAWNRFPFIMMALMGAVIYSQPLGTELQRYVTTEGDVGEMELISVTRREIKLPGGRQSVVHHVMTRRG